MENQSFIDVQIGSLPPRGTTPRHSCDRRRLIVVSHPSDAQITVNPKIQMNV
jgi:hypothetical protein